MYLYRKCLSNLARGFSTKPGNHYDSLGITPHATQADVKAAYYKLSKQYHPDTNQGKDDAIQKFREVTEAYEVLGNVKMRRLYDKGMTHVGSRVFEEDDPSTRFYKSREVRARPPPPSGRTPIYDYDEWARNHYSTTFNRDMQYKRARQYRTRMRELEKNDLPMENLMYLLVVMTILTYCLSTMNNHDRVVYEAKERQKSEAAEK